MLSAHLGTKFPSSAPSVRGCLLRTQEDEALHSARPSRSHHPAQVNSKPLGRRGLTPQVPGRSASNLEPETSAYETASDRVAPCRMAPPREVLLNQERYTRSAPFAKRSTGRTVVRRETSTIPHPAAAHRDSAAVMAHQLHGRLSSRIGTQVSTWPARHSPRITANCRSQASSASRQGLPRRRGDSSSRPSTTASISNSAVRRTSADWHLRL